MKRWMHWGKTLAVGSSSGTSRFHKDAPLWLDRLHMVKILLTGTGVKLVEKTRNPWLYSEAAPMWNELAQNKSSEMLD